MPVLVTLRWINRFQEGTRPDGKAGRCIATRASDAYSVRSTCVYDEFSRAHSTVCRVAAHVHIARAWLAFSNLPYPRELGVSFAN